jgi:siroheme synthase
MRQASAGSLVLVGSGIELGRHMSQRAWSEIQRADQVFVLADAFAFDCIARVRPDAQNLCEHYADDRDRRLSYRAMEAAIVDPVIAGHRVCGVFYGHPGVFADVAHNAIAQARARGHRARMEPGISAADCLFADLGIDPGRCGLQCYEATQFLVGERPIDSSALLLLWQVALAGNVACVGFEPVPERLQLLVDKLLRWYKPDTEVILYEAATLPIADFRADRMALIDLPRARYREYTTLVIPPSTRPRPDTLSRAALTGL